MPRKRKFTDEEFNRLVQAAHKRNRSMDRIDRGAGFAAPDPSSAVMQVWTAMLALQFGIEADNLDAIMEAYALLDDFLKTAGHPGHRPHSEQAQTQRPPGTHGQRWCRFSVAKLSHA
jgi:hypothetical protein